MILSFVNQSKGEDNKSGKNKTGYHQLYRMAKILRKTLHLHHVHPKTALRSCIGEKLVNTYLLGIL